MTTQPRLQRRGFLRGVSALALTGLLTPRVASGESWVQARPRRPGYRASYYVPGYHPSAARHRGQPALASPSLRRNLPAGYEQDIVLLSRVPEDGSPPVRMLMPVKGHDVDIHPDGRIGVFNSQNGATMLSFDPVSLELAVLHRYEDGVAGGGHSVFLPDGNHLAVTERSAYRPYSGTPEAHEGRIAIRDVGSLKAVESYSSHGMAPHEVQLMHDGKHIAVANYGSAYAPDGGSQLPYVIDPCITILELASGRLVERIRPREGRGTAEIRHVAAYDRDRVFALQNKFVSPGEQAALLAGADDLYLPDLAAKEGKVETAVPVLHAARGGAPGFDELVTGELRHMIRAQSITYDPVHDEAIATFPGANRIVVFAGRDGSVLHEIDSAATGGLRLPRGVTLHPDGEHYAVAGAYNDIALFRRGSHERIMERTVYVLLFGHSHITAI